MKQIFIFLVSLMIYSSLVAADPGWSVTPSSYSYSMTVTAVLDVNCIELENPSNRLGAFVGADVRGSSLSSTVVNGRFIALLTVYSNSVSGETITFKIYDADTDQVFDAVTELQFQDDASYGTPSFPQLVTENNRPTDLMLSANQIAENNVAGALVGTLSLTDKDAVDTHTYTLVSGIGDTDNAEFSIVSDELRINDIADYETKTEYSIRVRGEDNGGCGLESTYTIQVLQVNEAPTAVNLSNVSIEEERAAPIEIGVLSSEDEDAGETFSYALVAGTGDVDNGVFFIDEDRLLTNIKMDYEEKNSYSARIRTTDSGDNTYEEVFTILVEDVNDPLYDLKLTGKEISENQPAATLIGVFSITDEDNPETITYELIDGENDNDMFTISGVNVISNAAFDYETKAEYLIHVRASDSGGASVEEAFTIMIIDENEAPSNIILSNAQIEENIPPSEVAMMTSEDQDGGESFTYDLVTGSGDTDNSSFSINDDRLLSVVQFDYETKSSHSVRVRTTDSGGNSFEKQFTIQIIDVNESPYDLALSSSSIAENLPEGSAIGTLSASDDDIGEVLTYTLREDGENDNDVFAIDGDELQSIGSLNYELEDEYLVEVVVTDSEGASIKNSWIITVIDQNDLPTDFSLSNTTLPEDQAIGTEVGVLSVYDEDPNDSHSFSLSSDNGSNDNSNFTIVNNLLKTEEVFDYGLNQSFNIEVTVEDTNGGTVIQIFEILVEEVSDTKFPSIDVVTPNGDGINDAWVIQEPQNFSNYSVVIYNSNGRIVYNVTSNYQNEWDGTNNGNNPAGIYYYVVQSNSKPNKRFSGTISLIK